MRKPAATIAAVAVGSMLALAACSSTGGTDDTAALTGVFVDSPVEGLRYEAAPSGLTGLTDAGGTFQYRTGDVVTFAVGDDVLGAAPGAAELNPMDITEDDRGNHVDVLQVLQSADADGDPENGIDVVGVELPEDCDLDDRSGCEVTPEAAQAHFDASLPADAYLGEQTVWKTQLADGCQITRNGECFRIKGITYSPAPVGYNGKYGPALGDLFWDSFKADNGSDVWNWYSLWGTGKLGGTSYTARQDLGRIKDLGVNTIRVYAMLSRQLAAGASEGAGAPPVPAPGTGHEFTHSRFLGELSKAGLQVMVDIPMPDTVYWQDKYDQKQAEGANDVAFWETVLAETVTELAKQPSVMAFNIMNEHDGATTAFNPGDGPATAKNDFFYYQAIKYASTVKELAPDKLVGWAIHEDPVLLYWASTHQFTAGPLQGRTYLEELKKVFDYWGVNTYHADSLVAVLGQSPPAGQYTYPTLPEAVRLPVIFTEFGWPTTGREGDQLLLTEATRSSTATTIRKMYPEAYAEQTVFAGAFFFSYSQEWWKSDDANAWNITPNQVANTFPNQYWDEEGFGLYSVGKPGTKDPVTGPWCGAGPCLPYDQLVELTPATTALRDVYR